MGDAPLQRQQSNDDFKLGPGGSSPQSLINAGGQQSPSNMAYDGYSQSQFMTGASAGASMDMRSLAGALPNYPAHNYSRQTFQHYPGQQNTMYQYSHGAQFAGQAGAPYNMNTTQQFQQYPQVRSGYPNVPVSNQSYQSPGHHVPQGMIQNSPAFSSQQHLHPSAQYSNFAPRGGHGPRGQAPAPLHHNTIPQMSRTSSNSSMQAGTSSALRGPPRKPKQSGHALWVGNLPPGTNIIDLKDYFSKDATNDIESVFLISKSNCAFVNYKSEESCQAAMARFHETRFQGVRLVCRLRRGSSPSSGPQEAEVQSDARPEPSPSLPLQEKTKEKFFVVKSLTIEDLERSVQSGVWATQAHNEAALTEAYKAADDVYLIFSANKSGEYFGYARMNSAIGDEEAAAKTEFPPTAATDVSPSPTPVDVPMTITTPPTATAPKGRVIDDSSRGTIFWEAINTTLEPGGGKDSEEPSAASSSGNVSSGEAGYDSAVSGSPTPQSFGKPFKIVWISTNKLPFYRTRGLRNPWNANREVKIARDGTEIEPGIGRRLVQMFHMKFPDPVLQQQQQQQHQQMNIAGARGGMPPPMHPNQMTQGFMMPGAGAGAGEMMHPGYGGGNY